MNNNNFFQVIVNLTADIIWEVDENWYYTFIDGKYKEYYGYAKEEIIGKTLFFLAPENESEKLLIILNNFAFKKDNITDIELKLINKNNKINYLNITAIPVCDNDNKFKGYRGIARDVTETKNAIEQSKKSERRFRDLFESNPHGIAIANKNGFIVHANKIWKKMFGYSDSDMHILHMNDFRNEHDRKTDFLLFRSIIGGTDDLYRIERNFIKKDGSCFWCDLTVALIGNPEEYQPYAIGLYADITERKKIEEELKRFHGELENLVSERTEEINRLTHKVINSQEDERQRIARDLNDGIGQTILAAKYAISSFTKGNNTDISLLERGKLLIDMASQELREVYTGIYPSMLTELGLGSTINWFIRNFLETSGIIVHYRNTLNENITYNLKVNIYRIIQELFNNIVKHSNAGYVDVSLIQDDQFIIIEISDDGKGFEIEKTRKNSTGAGLINVRQRVEYLKGHIEMESMQGKTWIKIEIPLENQ